MHMVFAPLHIHKDPINSILEHNAHVEYVLTYSTLIEVQGVQPSFLSNA